jgi:hypothetical protein
MFSELRELRVKQHLSTIRTQIYNNIFTIPTLDEIMSLAPSSFASTNREINQGKFKNEQNFIKGKLKRKPLTSCRAAAKHTFFWSIFSSTAFGLSKKWVSARCAIFVSNTGVL